MAIYYAQNIEFESMLSAPAKYSIFYKVYNKGLKNLERGVTKRFIEATNQLKKSKTQSNSKTTKTDNHRQEQPSKSDLSKKGTKTYNKKELKPSEKAQSPIRKKKTKTKRKNKSASTAFKEKNK